MTINERIRYFRKEILHMSQVEFAKRLGMKQTSVSTIEKTGGTVTSPTINALCLAFNLNKNWLEEGKEPMLLEPQTFSLDQFVKEQGASDLELAIMEIYFKLDYSTRKRMIAHFKEHLSNRMIDIRTRSYMTDEEIEAEGERVKRELYAQRDIGTMETTSELAPFMPEKSLDVMSELAEIKRQNQEMKRQNQEMKRQNQEMAQQNQEVVRQNKELLTRLEVLEKEENEWEREHTKQNISPTRSHTQ